MSITKIIAEYPLPMKDFSRLDVLIDHLLFNHGVMLASENLLEKAIQKSVEGLVRSYYIQHLSEERSHDKWLTEDLATVGVSPQAIHWGAARLVGTQLYLIEYVSPVALLGYMAILECRPFPLEYIEKLEAIHGPALLRCMRFHAIHDVDHGADLLDVIEKLNAGAKALVLQNAAHTAWLLGDSNGV